MNANSKTAASLVRELPDVSALSFVRSLGYRTLALLWRRFFVVRCRRTRRMQTSAAVVHGVNTGYGEDVFRSGPVCESSMPSRRLRSYSRWERKIFKCPLDGGGLRRSAEGKKE